MIENVNAGEKPNLIRFKVQSLEATTNPCSQLNPYWYRDATKITNLRHFTSPSLADPS